jgi:hypothetical protein
MDTIDDRRLSAAQWKMLRSAQRTGNPSAHLSGRSAHGGGELTRMSLTKRGYLNSDGTVTERGLERLRAAGDL